MTKILKILIVMLLGMGVANAQQVLDDSARAGAISRAAALQTPWQTVSLSGKLKMTGLPVTPSVKIFMQRDSLVQISLRAPFVGEVGRAEITDSTLLVVNKMDKRYVEERLDSALANYPVSLADVQELLLGRIVIPGFGLLGDGVEEMCEFFDGEEGNYAIIATEDYQPEGFNYGYMVNADGSPAALMVLDTKKPGNGVIIEYARDNKGYDLDVEWLKEGKSKKASLELDSPQWDAKGFDRIKLNSKYRKVKFEELVK